MAEGTVSTILSEWLLVILIVISLAFEVVLHRIEHWVSHRHNHLQTVLKVLYRELMILGLVSFSFIVYELNAKPKGDTVLSFEFAHVFIFLLAIFYTIVVLCSMFTSLRLSARWKKMEKIDLVRYLQLKDSYTSYRTTIYRHRGPYWRSFQWWFPKFFTLWDYWQLHEIMAFHDIRFQVIFYRNLPEHFRFSSFLRKIKSATFIELVESHWSLWAIFLAIVLVDILRRNVISDPAQSGNEDVAESAFIIAAALLLMIFVQTLASKIRKIYWELTRHPRTYYEGVQPADLAEEIVAAQTRIVQERQRRRSKSAELTSRSSLPEDSGNDADTETDVPDSADEAAAPNTDDVKIEITPAVQEGNHVDDDDITPAPVARGLEKVSLDEEEIASRHSLDYTRLKYGSSSQEDSLDLARRSIDRQRAQTSLGIQGQSRPSQDVVVPIEFDEVAVRHSLEFNGRQAEAVSRPAPVHKKSSVALAAVEAARRRASDVNFDRHSIENTQLRPGGGGERQRPAATSVSDKVRCIGSPRLLSRLSSRGVSTDDDAGMSMSEHTRASTEGHKVSIELAAALPREEMAVRHHSQEDPDADVGEYDDGPIVAPISRTRQKGHGNAPIPTDKLGRSKSIRYMNASILKNLEHQEVAKQMEPNEYHWIVKKLIPRLTRVASPVEKLFWFGSHKFFMWCVEFTLFFSTVLMAAATASVFLIAIDKYRGMSGLNIASICLAGINLLFVLFRIAGIIKKYIFILHNASLVPESVALKAIHTVAKKQPSFEDDDSSDLSGSETEREDSHVAVERRKTLGRFFRSEAASGNVMGIPAVEERESKDGSKKRLSLRRSDIRSRRSRVISAMQDRNIPEVPVARPADRPVAAEESTVS